ncbi:MAG: hypothetical protein JWO86_8917, partial [Myxococcaceae bacterium]|nr:hypothetical protein [Myxococcaceae bacterium]
LRVLCRAHNLRHAEEVFGRAHVAKRIHFRQRKRGDSATDAATNSATDAATDAAMRGLVNLGFRDSEARRGVSVVRERHPENIAIEATLREALGLLTAS